MNHLRPKGRAGIIVPEGIIFQSGTGHKQLRKNLVEDGLYAVVSLPQACFAPYSGVKTSILLFNNELAKTSKEILFVKIEGDGFDFGAQRRITTKNDLPKALDILNNWNTGKKIENKLAVYVEKSKIAENGEYNLSVDRYRIATDYTNAKWPMVELKELCEITTGKKDVNEGNPNGEFPFFTCAKENTFIDTFSFDTEALLIAGNGDVGAVKYYKGKFDAYQRTYVLSNFKNVNVRYLFQILNNSLKENMQLQKLGNTMPYIKLGMLQTFLVPLPPLEIQEQIVTELDSYAGIIAGSKQISQNWKPKIDIDPKWQKMKLDRIVSFSQGVQVDLEDQLKTPTKDYEKFLRIENYTQNSDAFRYIPKKMGREKFVTKDDVVVVRYGASAGFIGRGLDGILANNLFLVTPEIKELDISYLYHYLNSDLAQTYLKQAMAGGAMPALSFGIVKELEIVIPPLTVQKQIVEKIEAERTLVESAKKLIDIYETKTKDAISKLWNE